MNAACLLTAVTQHSWPLQGQAQRRSRVVPAPSSPFHPLGSQLSSWGWNDRGGGGGTPKPNSLLRTFLTRKKGTRIFLPTAPKNSAVLEFPTLII